MLQNDKENESKSDKPPTDPIRPNSKMEGRDIDLHGAEGAMLFVLLSWGISRGR